MQREFTLAAATILVGLWAYAVAGWPAAGLLVALAGMLVALAEADIRTGHLPNVLTLGLLFTGLLLPWLVGSGLEAHALGALAGGAVGLFIVATTLWLLGKPGWGGGDVKMLAGLGAWVGIGGILPLVLFASLLAVGWMCGWRLATGRRLRQIPFGPFLAAGGWLAMLYQPVFWSWLLQ